MKIITEHVYPPIPTRTMDWSAAMDNYEPGLPLEYGATEQEAVENLLDNWCKDRGADLDNNNGCLICEAETGEKCRAVRA